MFLVLFLQGSSEADDLIFKLNDPGCTSLDPSGLFVVPESFDFFEEGLLGLLEGAYLLPKGLILPL